MTARGSKALVLDNDFDAFFADFDSAQLKTTQGQGAAVKQAAINASKSVIGGGSNLSTMPSSLISQPTPAPILIPKHVPSLLEQLIEMNQDLSFV